MKHVTFGKSGVEVSEMCLGTMMFGDRCDGPETDRIVSAALERGVNFIDTASMYCRGRTEEILGRVLKGKRDRVFLATKGNVIDYDGVKASIDESLTRLRMDAVDLYMIHWPQPGMKPTDTMRALNDVVKAGKARFVGCSNFPAWLVTYCNAIARENGWPELVCNQVPYNPIERGIEVEVLQQSRVENIAVTVYRALLQGLFCGKYHPDTPLPAGLRADTDKRITDWLSRYADGLRHLLQLAEDKRVPPSYIGLGWVRACPVVTCPLVGVSRFEQLEDTIGAFEFDLTPEERDAVSKAFGAEVKEESAGRYAALRRDLTLVVE